MGCRAGSFWTGLVVLVGLWLALAAMLGYQTPRMSPIQPGTVDEFWKHATGVDREWRTSSRTRRLIYGPFDEWYVYEWQHLHGSLLYRVRKDVVQATVGSVREALDDPAIRNGLDPAVREAILLWEKLPSGPDRNEASFLKLICNEQLGALKARSPDLHDYQFQRQGDVAARWSHSGWYWAAITFEAVYLGLLSLFLCWPLLRGTGRIAWAIHLGLTPLLFMLPAYLGYATMSFSSAGPSGGVAYPWILIRFPQAWFASLDRTLFLALPKFLAPLSQLPGPPMALSWRSMPGPATALAMGALLAAFPFLFSRKPWNYVLAGPRGDKPSSEQDS